MSAFFLSLSLSRVVFTLHGAKETGTHRTPVETLAERERALHSVYTQRAYDKVENFRDHLKEYSYVLIP